MKLTRLDRFSKNTQMLDFMNIRLVGAQCSTRTDKQRHCEVNIRFSQLRERA